MFRLGLIGPVGRGRISSSLLSKGQLVKPSYKRLELTSYHITNGNYQHQRRYLFGASRASKTPAEKNEQETPQKDKTVDLTNHPIFKRLPKFLHKYAVNFINTPVSHVTSFIVLHELTAVVPLFALWGTFHYLDFTPQLGDWIMERGIEFIKAMGERNGWDFSGPEKGYRLILQGASAYAIVKTLLPLRAAISLFLTPWFARRFVIPITRVFRRKKVVDKAPDDKIWDQDLKSKIPKKDVKKNQDPNKPEL